MKRCFRLICLSLMLMSASVQAETFYLKDGSVIDGTTLRSLGNTLSIKLDDSGMYQLPVEMVDKVAIVTVDGQLVEGSLVHWTGGIYLLVTSQGLVEIKNGVVINAVEDGDIAGSDTSPTQANTREDLSPARAARQPEELQPAKLQPTM
jgi:hypothetical protein